VKAGDSKGRINTGDGGESKASEVQRSVEYESFKAEREGKIFVNFLRD